MKKEIRKSGNIHTYYITGAAEVGGPFGMAPPPPDFAGIEKKT